MPHLSPMFWLLSPLMYIFILTLMMSSMWWIHHPNFPLFYTEHKYSNHLWTWE